MSANKNNKSQYIPIALIWYYIILFFFTNLQEYADNYYTFIVFTDTFLLTLSFLHYCYDLFTKSNEWGFTAKKSLLTVISLNVLTELSFIIDIRNYYLYYMIIICIYLFSLMVHAYNSYKNTQK